MTDDEKEQIAQLYHDQGLSQKEVAEELGLSKTTVHRKMKKYGIDARGTADHLRKEIDEQKLEDLYYEQDMTLREVASEFDVSCSTILNRMRDYGMSRRDKTELQKIDKPDKELLIELYWGNNFSTNDIADIFDVSKYPVLSWFDEYGIDKRSTSRASEISGLYKHPHFRNRNGYEMVKTEHKGEQWEVPIHRLAAVAWFGFDEVVDKHVHHKNGVKWDNREENLEPLTASEHAILHREMEQSNSSHNGLVA